MKRPRHLRNRVSDLGSTVVFFVAMPIFATWIGSKLMIHGLALAAREALDIVREAVALERPASVRSKSNPYHVN